MKRPREILQQLLKGLSDQNWDAIADLYAEDVIIKWPMAVPSPIIIRGRQILKNTLQQGWQLLELIALSLIFDLL